MKELPNKWKPYLQNGEWTGPEEIRVDGKWVKVDAYLTTKPKKVEKHINIDIEDNHADMDEPFDQGHTEIDGDGDSESSE
jgi:hypothetical protein